MSNSARFRFSATDGILELEGSEQFIEKQIESLKDVISSISQRPIEVAATTAPNPEAIPTPPQLVSGPTGVHTPTNSNESPECYPRTYADKNGELVIVAKIQGNNTKSKMRNAALLYCYGSHLKGQDFAPWDSIRGVCEDHGFLDSHNFSKIFKDRTLFVEDGTKGGKKSAKLTVTGRERAKSLIEGIESSAS